jgi:hypothetical protein
MIHQLDRRYKMHRAGFKMMLVWAWPASSNEFSAGHPWPDCRRYQVVAERVFGLAYYESINKLGNWKWERKYRNVQGGRDIVEERIYIRSEKHLTLLQLAI